MGNFQSRGGFRRADRSPMGSYPYESNYRSSRRSSYPYTRATAHSLESVNIPNLPTVARENQLLYELALERYYIRRNEHIKRHAILCDLKCSLSRELLPRARRPARFRLPALPPPPPRLRSTASDEQLERDAIARCCCAPRKRRLPPITLCEEPCGTPCARAMAAARALADAKARDARQRRCFWRAFVSGWNEPWAAGTGAASALRLALETDPPPCQPPPPPPCTNPSVPCFGADLPLRAPLMACPQQPRPAPAPRCVAPADVQRALENAWCSGASLEAAAMAAAGTAPPHWMCRPPPPPQPAPMQQPPRPGLWSSTPPAPPPILRPSPSLWPPSPPAAPPNTYPPCAFPPPPPSPPCHSWSCPPPPTLPAPYPSTTPPPGQCAPPRPPQPPPKQPFFAECLEVGEAAPCNVGVAVFADGVVAAAARGWQTQGGRRISSALSRRWSLPAGVRWESLACFLCRGRLVIVSLPPPALLAAELASPHTRRLPPPMRLPFTYAQAPDPLCFMRK